MSSSDEEFRRIVRKPAGPRVLVDDDDQAPAAPRVARRLFDDAPSPPRAPHVLEEDPPLPSARPGPRLKRWLGAGAAILLLASAIAVVRLRSPSDELLRADVPVPPEIASALVTLQSPSLTRPLLGFLISYDGYLLTSADTLEGKAPRVLAPWTVRFSDGTTAHVVECESEPDDAIHLQRMAVLRVSPSPAHALFLSTIDQLDPGSAVAAPRLADNRPDSLVMRTRRLIDASPSGFFPFRFLALAGSVDPALLGSPLFDDDAHLVGVVTGSSHDGGQNVDSVRAMRERLKRARQRVFVGCGP